MYCSYCKKVVNPILFNFQLFWCFTAGKLSLHWKDFYKNKKKSFVIKSRLYKEGKLFKGVWVWQVKGRGEEKKKKRQAQIKESKMQGGAKRGRRAKKLLTPFTFQNKKKKFNKNFFYGFKIFFMVLKANVTRIRLKRRLFDHLWQEKKNYYFSINVCPVCFPRIPGSQNKNRELKFFLFFVYH